MGAPGTEPGTSRVEDPREGWQRVAPNGESRFAAHCATRSDGVLFPHCFHHEFTAARTRSSARAALKRETNRSVVDVRLWAIASAICARRQAALGEQ